MKIVWSPLAIKKNQSIAVFIAKDKPTAGVKWATSVFLRIERLKKNPLSGRIIPELSRNYLREIIFGNYRLVYRYSQKEIVILTVHHNKQIFSSNLN